MPLLSKVNVESRDGSTRTVTQTPGSGSKSETTVDVGAATSDSEESRAGTRTTTKAGHDIVTVSARPESDTIKKVGEHYGIHVKMTIEFQNKEPLNPAT